MLTWELVGAVVGAGLASGREIASFFAQYGAWGYGGAIAAVAVLILFANIKLPISWRDRWPERLWNVLLSLLLVATGGAMLSGAGEVVALTLPVHHAYWIGLFGTLILSWLLARRTTKGLACVSRLLLAVLMLMIGLGLFIPGQDAAILSDNQPVQSMGRGVTYGGFNAALQAPIMAKAACTAENKRRYAARWAGVIIFCLLLLGIAVLQRHPVLLLEPMPFLKMMSVYGKVGFILGAFSLYLAILSTLTACLHGLNGAALPMMGIIIVALVGFSGVVEWAYPLLGGLCFAMMFAAKLTKWFVKV